MTNNEIIFQLKKTATLDDFSERFQSLSVLPRSLYNIDRRVELFRESAPHLSEVSNHRLFTESIFPEMNETEQRLYRTYLISGLSEANFRFVFKKLESDISRDDNIIVWVQPGYVYRLEYKSEVTIKNVSWGIGHLNCREAWDNFGTQGEGVIVAVLDSGVNYCHEHIKNNMWSKQKTDRNGNSYLIHGYDYVNETEFPLDDMGHGTHCAGIIAGENKNDALIGVAPKAKIMAQKILGEKKDGTSPQTTTPLCARAIVEAADNGAQILSNSWQWGYGDPKLDDALKEAIIHAVDNKNCIVVFAAGNEGISIKNYFPANYQDKVISVAGTDQNSRRVRHSNWGTEVTIAGPGIGIISLGYQNNTDFVTVLVDGTSLACPHIAGIAALLLKINDKFSLNQIKNFLWASGLRLPEEQERPIGKGIGANAAASVKAASDQ